MQTSQGGLPGGIWGSLPAPEDSAAGVILNGNYYRNTADGEFQCIDVRTGELLWTAAGSITSAQSIIPAFQTESQLSQGGVSQWLWGGTSTMLGLGTMAFPGSDTWTQYDPFDGHVIKKITDVPTTLTGISFTYGSPVAWCAQADMTTWNTTEPLKISSVNLIKWDYSKLNLRIGSLVNVPTTDWQSGVVMNVTVNLGDLSEPGDNAFRGVVAIPYLEANVVVVKSINAMQTMAGYDMDTGALLWKNNATVLDIDVLAQGIATSQSGPLLKQDGATPNLVAYDVKTGKEIWRAPSGELPWGMLPTYSYIYHNGTHYIASMDGHVYAIDQNSGDIAWTSDYIGESWETIYGNQPITGADTGSGSPIGADGMLYYSTKPIYRMMPRPRFHELLAINETTGHFAWRLPIGIAPVAIADGYLVGSDIDNGMLYSIGKGPSVITVNAPDTAVTKGSSVMLKGTIIDNSAGTKNSDLTTRFPLGVPAISDADMSEWMSYLYGQNATLLNNPPKPNGVTVRLTAVDPNGNSIDIGTVTSDNSGTFSYMWQPENEGKYTIYATFDGSESYWGSYAATALGVVKTETTSTTTPISFDSVTNTMMTISIGLGIVIIIAIAVVAVLLLKKKP
jgi:outer membrane protein assembly factor BamB